MPLSIDLASYMLRLKNKKGISFNEVARLAGVDQRTIRTYLQQKPVRYSDFCQLRVETADAIMKALGGNWIEFFQERELGVYDEK